MSSSKDALTTKLTAIADSVRSKTGGGGTELTLDQIKSQIDGLEVGQTPYTGYFGFVSDKGTTGDFYGTKSYSYTFPKPFDDVNYNVSANYAAGIPWVNNFRGTINGTYNGPSNSAPSITKPALSKTNTGIQMSIKLTNSSTNNAGIFLYSFTIWK